MQFVWVGVAGSLGAITRYWLDGVVSRWATGAFPWGTFVVNISGCFVIGFLSAVLTGKFLPHPVLRTAVLVGFVGAYTTFSTFAYESSSCAGRRRCHGCRQPGRIGDGRSGGSVVRYHDRRGAVRLSGLFLARRLGGRRHLFVQRFQGGIVNT